MSGDRTSTENGDGRGASENGRDSHEIGDGTDLTDGTDAIDGTDDGPTTTINTINTTTMTYTDVTHHG